MAGTACRPLFARHRRGGVYIMTLAVGMIISVIGLSAVLLVRIQRRRMEATSEAVKARALAPSLVDLGVYRIAGDPNWRTTYQHDTWTAEETDFGLTWSLKLCDEQDADLANDDTQSVRLYAKVASGRAVRIVSLLLQPPGHAEQLLLNADMKNGVSNWSDGGACLLDARVDGTDVDYHLRAKGRNTAAAGPRQDVTGKIASGKAYYTEAWVTMKDQPESVVIVLYTNSTGGGEREFRLTSSAIGMTWKKASGTLTPTWSGTLLSAHWRIETVSTTQDLRIDEVVLIEGTGGTPESELTPVPGTWRQDIAP